MPYAHVRIPSKRLDCAHVGIYNNYMSTAGNEFSYEEKADALENPPYVYTEKCAECGKSFPEGTLQLIEEYHSVFCEECFPKVSLILAAEGCDQLQQAAIAASSVSEIRELFDRHRVEMTCVHCFSTAKTVQSDRISVNPAAVCCERKVA